jgi:hypothetical protein
MIDIHTTRTVQTQSPVKSRYWEKKINKSLRLSTSSLDSRLGRCPNARLGAPLDDPQRRLGE